MRPLEITPHERDALYKDVVDHLSGLGDLLLALDQKDFVRARRLAQEFSDDLLFLLNDLGFGDETDADAALHLTTKPSILRRLLGRLRDRALAADRAEAEEREDIRRAEAHGTLVRGIYGNLLSEMAACE
jgi:hypothetical protein